MNGLLNVLMAEDSPDDAQLILFQLEQEGLEVKHRRVDSEAAFRAALDQPPDLILSDFAMPRFSGLQALRIVKERGLDIPFILISGTIGEEIAVEAMKLGADDYLMKDRLARLGSAIQSVLDKKSLGEEKARADIALRHSEARFRSLIENSSDEVSIVSADGSLLYESPSSKPTLGYQTGAFINQNLFQLVHPDDLERVQRQFSLLLEDPGQHPRERFRLLHQNGTWRWVEAVGTNLLHEPAVGGIVVNYHDVTERVQAEEQIQYQASLLENVSDAVVSTDVNGIIKSWNRAAESMFGFTEKEVIGQSAMDIIKTEYVSASREVMAAQLWETGSWRGEVRVYRKDGTPVDSISSVSVIKDSQGHNLGIISLNHDITERKQVEAKLQASETRYRLATRATNDVIWEWNAQTNQLIWAENAQIVFGYAPGEIGPDATWWDNHIHPQDREHVLSRLNETLQRGDSMWSDEYRFLLSNGSYAYISDHGYIERDADSTAIRLIGAMSNVTEQKRAEAALRASEEQYRSLFEDSPVSLWVEDFSEVKQRLNGLMENGVVDIPAYLRQHPDFVLDCIHRIKVLDVNGAALKMYHARDKAELLGSLTDILIDPSPTQFEPELIRIAEGRFEFEREGVDQTRTGETIYVNIHWSVAPGYEDNLAKVIVSITDVTERKQAEEKIQRQLRRLSALRTIDMAISSTFDMKISLTVILSGALSQLGISAAAILLFNPALSTLEYAAGQGFYSSAIQQSRLRIGQGLAGKAALERQTVHAVNLNQVGTDFVRAELLKDEGFVSYYAVPLIAKGELKGMLEIFHRKQLHPDQEWLDFLETLGGQAAIAIDNAQLFENLQRSNTELERRVAERTAELNRTNIELESANRAKDEFLASMSHELRTPLNSILGLSESLLEQRRGVLNEHQEKSLQTIEASGRHLLELITDILDLSKIQAGKFEFRPQVVLVDDLCRSSLAFINNQAVKKSIKVTYESETSITSISADPRRLKQILINLLSNAVKFTHDNGQVILQVQANPEVDRIQFSVIDTGIGIAPDDMRRLFQPFVQLDSTLNRQFDGTGLGLTLVQKLIDLHGGSVEVESEVGKGSRFTVYLPLEPGTPGASEGVELQVEPLDPRLPEQDRASKDSKTSKTVLIAEDNAANILTVGDYLESHGYEIVIAHDGVEAIEKAETTNPDVILMDVQMPVMDGLEAMTRLRMNPRFTSTPIIALTALAMPGDRERCIKAGATEYMSKPVGLRILADTITKLLDHAG